MGNPATARCAAGAARPSSTRQTSVDVPPMSKVTASENPAAPATAAAASTPPAGPDRSRAAGFFAAASTGTRPPADVNTSTDGASGTRASR